MIETIAACGFDRIVQLVVRWPVLGRLLAFLLRGLPLQDLDRQRLRDMGKRCRNDDKLITLGRKIAGLDGAIRHRLLRNFFARRLQQFNVRAKGKKLPFPRVLVTFVTSRCNLSCPYCFSKDNTQPHMEEKLLRKVLEEGSNNGSVFVCIAGGEPMLRPGLINLLAEYPKLIFLLFTHGRLINDKAVEQIVRAANVFPIFSLDGTEAHTDQQRGKGTWAAVRDAMARLEARRMPFGFSSHLDRHNFEQVYTEDFVAEMCRRGAICGWYSHHIPNGAADYETTLLSPQQRIDSLGRCDEMKKKYPIVLIDSAADPRHVGGCPSAGHLMVFVDHNGNISPCPFIPFAGGNIRDTSIAQVLASRLFTATRDLGKVRNSHDHVAGCIALNKRNEMLELAKAEPAVVQLGGLAHLRRWESMKDAQDRYMEAVHKEIDREVVFVGDSDTAPRNAAPRPSRDGGGNGTAQPADTTV